jgi:hypothetical protein
MSAPKKAAIRPDKDLLNKPVQELSAVQLIEALNASRSPAAGAILADKKKYELWIEENPIPRITVAELIERLKGEKKKVELEIPPGFREVVNPPDFEHLVERVAEKVMEKLGK